MSWETVLNKNLIWVFLPHAKFLQKSPPGPMSHRTECHRVANPQELLAAPSMNSNQTFWDSPSKEYVERKFFKQIMESSVRPSDKAPAMIDFHLRMIWKVDVRVWNQSTAVQAILFIVRFPIMAPCQHLSNNLPAMAWLDLVLNDLAEVLAKHWWQLLVLGHSTGNTMKPKMQSNP